MTNERLKDLAIVAFMIAVLVALEEIIRLLYLRQNIIIQLPSEAEMKTIEGKATVVSEETVATQA